MGSSLPSPRIHLCLPSATLPYNHAPIYIVYFITGNPGLIEYYRIFLTHLFGRLTRSDARTSKLNLHIIGRSFPGFEAGPQGTGSSGRDDKPPYGLQEQISHTEEGLEAVVDQVRMVEGAKDVRVILMGHSVGAYVLLEVVQRLRRKAQQQRDDAIRVVGGVCLFPTVTFIAKSASGRRLGWLLSLAPFASTISALAKALTFLLPTSLLALLIRSILSFPPEAAHVTASFLKSRHGVQQALHMARDEMLQITADAWDAEIWGSESASPHKHPRPILRFLFGKEDHWVANETRDELIRIRGSHGGDDWKPLMEVDQSEGWPHGFCIKHSVPVAERVMAYLIDIIQKDAARSFTT